MTATPHGTRSHGVSASTAPGARPHPRAPGPTTEENTRDSVTDHSHPGSRRVPPPPRHPRRPPRRRRRPRHRRCRHDRDRRRRPGLRRGRRPRHGPVRRPDPRHGLPGRHLHGG
ncbi:hypothetical protein CXF45_06895 [Corynebacterium bovis]|nr:hypothetical protein CXF38_01325 [Corynebacterium bovis]RRO84259.1 hypothetical protein CXF36_00795 [Corynebacterium bovis]RRO85060.1 hypothetical protein CXF37_00890 [Corynebacterium bovis]RRO89755.1 hypothetical protein CXF45_06895 [Corynebacterium bovis]RRO96992.1 hypothetical protein CXF29_00500 [Corynebacterium bovis]